MIQAQRHFIDVDTLGQNSANRSSRNWDKLPFLRSSAFAGNLGKYHLKSKHEPLLWRHTGNENLPRLCYSRDHPSLGHFFSS
jgi:hypothetical protein